MALRKPANRTAAVEKLRGAELAKIHIAKKQLRLDDETYRAVLLKLTGKTSSKDLNASERGTILDYFKANGWQGKTHANRPNSIDSTSPHARTRQLKKIEALLTDAKRDWSYLTATLLQRLTQKQALEFCDSYELSKVIAALAIDAKRRKKKEKAHGRS